MDESVLLSLQVQLRNMHCKTITGFGFRMIAAIIKVSVCVIRLSLRLWQITQTLALIIIAIMRKPNPIIVNYFTVFNYMTVSNVYV